MNISFLFPFLYQWCNYSHASHWTIITSSHSLPPFCHSVIPLSPIIFWLLSSQITLLTGLSLIDCLFYCSLSYLTSIVHLILTASWLVTTPYAPRILSLLSYVPLHSYWTLHSTSTLVRINYLLCHRPDPFLLPFLQSSQYSLHSYWLIVELDLVPIDDYYSIATYTFSVYICTVNTEDPALIWSILLASQLLNTF